MDPPGNKVEENDDVRLVERRQRSRLRRNAATAEKALHGKDLHAHFAIRLLILHDEKFCGIATSIRFALRQARFLMRNEERRRSSSRLDGLR